MVNDLSKFKILLFPSPCQKHRRSFLALYQEDGGAPGGKYHENVGCLLRLYAPGVSHSHASPHSASKNSLLKLLFNCCYKLMAPMTSAPGRQISVVTF